MDEEKRLRDKIKRRILEYTGRLSSSSSSSLSLSPSPSLGLNSFYLLRNYEGKISNTRIKEIIDNVCEQMSDAKNHIIAARAKDGFLVTVSSRQSLASKQFQNFHYKYANARSPIKFTASDRDQITNRLRM